LFNPAKNRQTVEKHQWLQHIRQALGNGEFRLYYQPKVNMRTGRVMGVEALIRWQHPDQGLLAPGYFLPMMSDTELEIDVGKWVLEQALAQAAQWHQNGYELEVSVNIASAHLQSASFIDDVEQALSVHPQLDSRFLQLEIVETSALGDIASISRVIKMSRDVLGVSVALDDFGTGYSSLTHLRHLTASTIKIDQSFVRDMLDDPQDYTIVDGVTGLAEAFSRQVIAEGVETIEHGLMLLMMGCHHAQGYGIARPMPAQEVEQWITQYQPEPRWLRLASKPLSYYEQTLELFELTLERWYQLFERNIRQSGEDVEHWPIMDPRKCHCGSWIQRVKSQNLFDSEWLEKLEKAHADWHQLAWQMREQMLSGQNSQCREKLPEFADGFQAIRSLLVAIRLPKSIVSDLRESRNQ
jgi:EAL domain-containing protein (putative c-di-GMP-specific phosphodiesterase class I)